MYRPAPAKGQQLQLKWTSDSGKKNNININFLVQCSKSFSPSPGPHENPLSSESVHDFRRGRPWPEGFSKNFVQKKFALNVWPLLMQHLYGANGVALLSGEVEKGACAVASRAPEIKAQVVGVALLIYEFP